MIDEKKIELMKKLQRLVERGVGGEKEGAQKKLQQLMKKYNIEESDLSDDKLEEGNQKGDCYQRLCFYNHNKAGQDTDTGH